MLCFELVPRGLDGLAIEAADEDAALVVDLDGGAGLGLEALDVAPARSDDVADLRGPDPHDGDFFGGGGDVRAARGQRAGHVVEDVNAGVAGLIESAREQLIGEAIDLEVHPGGR